ncbi:MAG TPA: tetratricopeptide repeat protein [Candidatus Methylomirabilis sp.]|nr:tetratricopeptide repeat protein [Candidatus Methylomirabilis sp.]
MSYKKILKVFQHGLNLLEGNDYEAALKHFQKIQQDDPGNYQAYLALGQMLWVMDRFAEAEACLVKAADLFSTASHDTKEFKWEENPLINIALARCRDSAGKTAQALALLKTTVKKAAESLKAEGKISARALQIQIDKAEEWEQMGLAEEAFNVLSYAVDLYIIKPWKIIIE